MLIYKHKSELAEILDAAGYIDNYFQSNDYYWTSTYSANSYISGYRLLYMMSGAAISVSNPDKSNYSFGIYVK